MSDQEQQSSLSPPDRRGTADPGARELAEASDSEEHYSDAQSGPMSPARASPIPRTRVERVDDRPAYGEVPGTPAYRLREGDAEPDEIAIVPDPTDPSPPEPQQVSRPPTPGGHPIPKTVVEETPDAEGAVSRPGSRQRRKSDVHPDLVVKADGQTVDGAEAANDAPIQEPLSTPSTPTRTRRKSSPAPEEPPLNLSLPEPESAVSDAEDNGQNEDVGDDDFDNDFDDFEEGGEDGDFGDFDDDFQQAEAPPAPAPPPPLAAQAVPSLPFPIPNYENLSPSDLLTLTSPYLTALYPQPPTPNPPLSLPQPTKENPVFLTPRSASLWAQLVAPPPLQPPDWIRSRIRRLFLVSLGVPVDLDEILPASSKQKKLVLPSVRLRRASSAGSLGGGGSSRVSSDSRGGGGVAARSSAGTAGLEGGGDGGGGRRSTGSRTGSGKPGRRTGNGGGGNGGGGSGDAAARASDPERRFDLVSARQTCTLTDAALNGMTDAELRAHVERLQAMQGTAQAVLTYWQKRTDEKIGDREAFEGVIENLVKHARKVRK